MENYGVPSARIEMEIATADKVSLAMTMEIWKMFLFK